MVEAGRREARGRPSRGAQLDRLRARERDHPPHLHGDGARPVRRALPLVPAPAHAEGAGRAERPAQGRVPRGGAVTAAALRRPGSAELRLDAILLTVTAAAWALTADRMAGMDAGPGAELGGLGWFAVSWLLMMAATMLPALAPMVVEHGRRAAHAGAPALFAAGYLATWLAAGPVGYAAIEGVRSLDPGFLAWDEAGRYVAAGAIAAAGLYQLSAPKGRVPPPLPRARGVPARPLAPGAARRAADGRRARRLVRRLQLGADGGAARARRDEPDLDGANGRANRGRAGPATRRAPRRGAGARRARGLGRARARQRARAHRPALGADGRDGVDALRHRRPPRRPSSARGLPAIVRNSVTALSQCATGGVPLHLAGDGWSWLPR